ncbi:uncharacterized protein EI90DRAFT_3134853 [Cantharellus anzutake]|uniref:uncharacterized protein n=1 Tax=Cantharellus anzutake TaxID=1750568 RepID=UPI001905B312|nr:uncharacterized protein EI90DRAFT_3134853 [Cantharellus anzutake]KAF8316006.1 hypothetical protein EI90DRAFT_3134853 [Cantharellus anzutake]
MIHDPTQPDKPGSLIVASRKTSFLLSFPLAAQLEPVSPSTPRGSPIETDPDLPSLTSTSTGSLDLSSKQLGILTLRVSAACAHAGHSGKPSGVCGCQGTPA